MLGIGGALRDVGALVAALASFAAAPAMQLATTPADTPQVALRLIVSRHGQPVSDLQSHEIEVLDSGLAQTITAFEYVDTLTGNSPEPPGDFALVLDDLGTPRSGTGSAIAAGLGLVDALGPDDRLAIVNSGPFPLIQQLSTDRTSVRTTIRQFIGQRHTASTTSRTEACRRSVISLGVIENALEVLAEQPGTRRAMLVVSDEQRAYWGEARHEKCSAARKSFDRVIAASSRANAAIYAVDVSGQQTEALPSETTGRPPAGAVTKARRPSDTARGSLAMLAGMTGGTVSAAPERVSEGVHRMVRDSRQYYRVFYRQPDRARRDRNEFRHIHVHVRRPGVEVRARQRCVDHAPA